MGQLDRQSQLVWMGLATGADKSRRVDLASGPICLDRSTLLPEQTSLDGLTRPSDSRSLDGSTLLPQPRCQEGLTGLSEP